MTVGDVEVVYLCVAVRAIANKSLVKIRSTNTCHVKWLVPHCAFSDAVVHVNCIRHVLGVTPPPVTECKQTSSYVRDSQCCVFSWLMCLYVFEI